MDDEIPSRSSRILRRWVNLPEPGVAGWIRIFEKFEVFLQALAMLRKFSAKGFLPGDNLFAE